jgi:hypothetical protein
MTGWFEHRNEEDLMKRTKPNIAMNYNMYKIDVDKSYKYYSFK